jgi:hypothetical protein
MIPRICHLPQSPRPSYLEDLVPRRTLDTLNPDPLSYLHAQDELRDGRKARVGVGGRPCIAHGVVPAGDDSALDHKKDYIGLVWTNSESLSVGRSWPTTYCNTQDERCAGRRA